MQREHLLGAIAMTALVFTWSSNLVATRYSTLHGLTPFDLVALRYLIAGLVLLPAFCKLDFASLGGLGWPRGITLTILSGAPYMFIFFKALSLAPASHGAVLNPGLTPTVVFLALVALKQRSFSCVKMAALCLIFAGLVLVTSFSFSTGDNILLGDSLFLLSGLSWGLFTLFLSIWNAKPLPTTIIVSVLSLPCILPYLLFAESRLLTASFTHVALQGIFQGLINSIAGLTLLGYAVQRLGAQVATLFSPLVPLTATLLAIPFLGEIPTPSQWLGVVLVAFGILGVAKS